MAERTINLRFPIAGVNRRVGFQAQPPYTTFGALNVRPDSTIDGRARGGSRPGLATAFREALGPTVVTGTAAATFPNGINLTATASIFVAAMGRWGDRDSAMLADSAVYSSTTGLTTLTLHNSPASNITDPLWVGGIMVASTATEYPITAVSTSRIFTVSGDASAETITSLNIYFDQQATAGYLVFDDTLTRYDIFWSNAQYAILIGDTAAETNEDGFTVYYDGSPVRMLGTVRESKDAGVGRFVDHFNYFVTSATSLHSQSDQWEAQFGDFEQVNVGPQAFGVAYGDTSPTCVALIDKVQSITLPYSVELECLVATTETTAQRHSLFLRMNNTTPEPDTYGIEVYSYVVYSGAGWTRRLAYQFKVAAAVSESSEIWCGLNMASADAGTLSAVMTGDVLEMTWSSTISGEHTFTITLGTVASTSYRRVGFGINGDDLGQPPNELCCVNSFAFNYRQSAMAQYRQRLLASANQQLYVSDGAGALNEIANYNGSGGAVTLADQRIYGVEMGGKFYIADYEPVIVEGLGGTVATSILNDSGVTWTDYGVLYDTAVELFNHDNGGDGVYRITTVHATNGLTLSPAAATTMATTDYRIYRTPKYYDPVLDKLYSWFETQIVADSANPMPLGCPLIARYMGCIWLGGAPTARHIWYASRQNDPLDWDYSQTDSQGAVAGTSTEVGVIGDPLTAFIPYLDDFMIFACADSLWILRGHPKLGGRITNLSQTIGCIGAAAWCFTGNGTLVFMSRNGVYALPPGAGGVPQELSEASLPAEFKDIAEADQVELVYDAKRRGVEIFIKRAAGSRTSWWWDEKTGGFWPVEVVSTKFPSATMGGTVDELNRNIALLGCEDGYLRDFSATNIEDGVESYVFIGPFAADASASRDGMLRALSAIMAEVGDTVTWKLYTANTAEEVTNLAAASYFDTGTWTDARNYADSVRCRGGAFALRIGRTAAGSWALETVVARIEALGVFRKL